MANTYMNNQEPTCRMCGTLLGGQTKCPNCNFDTRDTAVRPEGSMNLGVRTAPPGLVAPKNTKLSTIGDTLSIHVKAREPDLGVPVVICALLGGLTSFIGVAAMSPDDMSTFLIGVLTLVFGSIYFGIYYIFPKGSGDGITKINVTSSAVEVTDPGKPDIYLNASEIIQVYCREESRIVQEYTEGGYYRNRGVFSSMMPREKVIVRQNFFYVRAVFRDGRTFDLVSDIENMNVALFIEQQIERKLGIKDVPEMNSFKY